MTKVSVVYDDRGNILAASHAVAGSDAVQPGPGEQAAVLDLPHAHAGVGLPEILQRLHVDVEARELIERGD
jgi:hypothetical protein